MNKSPGLILGLLLVVAMTTVVVVVEASSPPCNGNGTCSAEEQAAARRWLAPRQRFISYEALRKDNIPCKQRGSSYYGCNGQSRQANPYNRGCSAITHCYRHTE